MIYIIMMPKIIKRRPAVNFPQQLVIVTDENESILEIHGKETMLYSSLPLHFKEGSDLFSLEWRSFFRQALQRKKLYQTIESVNNEIIYVRKCMLFEEKHIYIFTNFSSPAGEENSSLIFNSLPMKRILTIINNISEVDSTVLLLGESGVGKSAVAKLIHEKSKRKNQPFVTINCGALPESLIEAELFGYEAGAFTGGDKNGKIGLFEAANNGTIFLDEIAELPYSMQSKLLEVIQENTIRRLGGRSEQKIDVRVMAATNKHLAELVERKEFREDLYYRLNVVPITIPPLRERQEDIFDLAVQLLAKFNHKYGREVIFSEEMQADLYSNKWQGNIRELSNYIERIVVTNEMNTGEWGELFSNKFETTTEDKIKKKYPTLKEVREKAEKKLIMEVYETFQNTYQAAEVLGVDQSTVSKKIKKYKQE